MQLTLWSEPPPSETTTGVFQRPNRARAEKGPAPAPDAGGVPSPGRRRLPAQGAQAGVLQPLSNAAELGALDALAERYVDGAHADATRRAYRSDWSAFEAWCGQHGVEAMPASQRTLERYLAHLAVATAITRRVKRR
jgi:hypothetical protein